MDLSGVNKAPQTYEGALLRRAKEADKLVGEAAVKLIDGATSVGRAGSAPAVSPAHKGQRLDIYA